MKTTSMLLLAASVVSGLHFTSPPNGATIYNSRGFTLTWTSNAADDAEYVLGYHTTPENGPCQQTHQILTTAQHSKVFGAGLFPTRGDYVLCVFKLGHYDRGYFDSGPYIVED